MEQRIVEQLGVEQLGVEQLGVLAKFWQAGAVKTRLAASIGGEAASRLYRLFLEMTLRQCDAVADRRILVYTPAERREAFATLAGPAWQLREQGAGNLGARIVRFFDTALRQAQQQGLPIDAARIVLIGSDSPTLPRKFIQQAFDALAGPPVVLGPARDGGFYLLGVRGELPDVLGEIPWSTPRVWPATVAALARAGLSFTELPSWYDVDQRADLESLAAELAAVRAVRVRLPVSDVAARLRHAVDASLTRADA